MSTQKNKSKQVNLTGSIILIVNLLLLCSSAIANDEFEAWKRQTLTEFSDYKSKQDKAFAAFLKMHWVGLNTLKGKPLYEDEKIIVPPKAPPEKNQPSAEKPVFVKIPAKKIIPKKQIVKTQPKIVNPIPTTIRTNTITVQFFGNTLTFPYDKSIKKKMRGKVSKQSISQQWSVLAKSDYEPLLKQIKISKKQLKLNDWAYALLTHKIAKQLYPNQKNEQALFSWFAMIKSGYKARIAYKSSNVYLLLAVKQQIYAVQSLKFNGTKYYALDFDGGKQPRLAKIYTYDGDYPDSKRLFDLRLQQAIVTGDNQTRRTLKFSFDQKKYTIKTVNNKFMIDFMRTYPQVHWATYFNSNPDTLPRQQVANQLRPHLKGMTEEEAINFLLRFVQTSLKYATDDKQFGYENPLFPEESLFYPASDCEDRSFLFAWLVQVLLELKVVGLLYPGHMATAVKLNMNVAGDSIQYKGSKYVVADPTYINANIGRAMPKFKNAKVEFVTISKL